MRRFTKIITVAAIGSAFSAAPAFAAAMHSPAAVTVDVPAVATPRVSTPAVKTPRESVQVKQRSIELPASGQAHLDPLGREVTTPDRTPAVVKRVDVARKSVEKITVDTQRVDVAAQTVSLPVGIEANKTSRGTGLGISAGASDINVDVAPHLSSRTRRKRIRRSRTSRPPSARPTLVANTTGLPPSCLWGRDDYESCR